MFIRLIDILRHAEGRRLTSYVIEKQVEIILAVVVRNSIRLCGWRLDQGLLHVPCIALGKLRVTKWGSCLFIQG